MIADAKSSAQVLILDDERELAAEFVDWLILKNISAQSACSYDEIIKLFDDNNECRVLLVDVRLPFAKGYEVVEKLMRRSSARPFPHVIYMSGSPTPEDFGNMGSICSFDFVNKPPDLDKLLEIIEQKLIRI